MPEVPTLFVFAGLPGSGKSTIAQRLAEKHRAAYLRIDTIEQAIRDLCGMEVEGEGYRLAYRVAADNLRIAVSVVADCCNPVELTRCEWEQVASEAKARCINIEIVCSDQVEHRRRVESRQPAMPRFKLPTWNEVQCRQYDAWTTDRIIVDSSGKQEDETFAELMAKLASVAADLMRTYTVSVDEAVAATIREHAQLQKISEQDFVAKVLEAHQHEYRRFPDGVLRDGRKKLIDLLSRIPCLHDFSSSGVDFRYWWVRFAVDENHLIRPHVIRRLAYLINTESAEMMLPTVLKQVPETLESVDTHWEIASTAPRFDPADLAKWLEDNLPERFWESEAWLGKRG